MEKRPIIKGVQGLPNPLRESASRALRAALTPAQRADDNALRILMQDMARYRQSGAISDHFDFYDEYGLPV